jgi:hypothetical protein
MRANQTITYGSFFLYDFNGMLCYLTFVQCSNLRAGTSISLYTLQESNVAENQVEYSIDGLNTNTIPILTGTDPLGMLHITILLLVI